MRTSDDREMDIPNLEAMDETQNYTLVSVANLTIGDQ